MYSGPGLEETVKLCPDCSSYDPPPAAPCEDCPGGRHYERQKARGLLLTFRQGSTIGWFAQAILVAVAAPEHAA